MVLFLAAALTGAPRLVGADDLAVARRHFEEAERHFAAGQYQDAYAAYQAAYEAAPLPDLLFNMGQCERKLGRNERALELFDQFVATNPPADRRAVVEDLIRELRAGAVDEPPGSGVPTDGLDPPRQAGADEPDIPEPTPRRARPARARRVSTRPTISPATWVAVFSSIALAGAGAVLTLRAEANADALDELGNDCGRARVVARCVALERDAQALFLAQNVIWALSGAAAVAALVLVTIDLGSAGAAGGHVSLRAPSSGAGLEIVGGWTW